MAKSLFISVLLVGAIVCSGKIVRAQAAPPTEQRITQPIIVNGQQVNGVAVIQNGALQSYTCPSPQQYVTADQSSGGWTCFDETTGTWLMNALPAQSADVYDQPSGVYDSGAAVYSYGYPYPYSYYPYSYPYGVYPYSYWGAPGFAFGFNSGHGFGHGHFEPHGNAHFGGSFGHGSFGHGSFNGSFSSRPAGGFGHGGSFGHGGGGGHAGGGHR